MHAGHAHPSDLLKGGTERCGPVLIVLFGDVSFDQTHGPVDKHAGRIAVLITYDRSPVGVGCIAGDAGKFKRAGVGPSRMAVDPPEPDRTFALGTVEFSRSGETVFLPQHLVPSAAPDPLQILILSGIAGNGFKGAF